jgi:hypothetical protein
MSRKWVSAVYWITTGIVCGVVAFSVVNFSLDHPIGPMTFGPGGPFGHLGLPHWFKVELTTGKVLGLIAFLLPGVPRKAKEFAYFGFGLTFVSACVAHSASGDGFWFRVDPLIFLGVLVVSYWAFDRLGRSSGLVEERGEGVPLGGRTVIQSGVRRCRTS